ncbi:enoyl-CoA hydratase/isomerase family protein [Alcaligenes sp. WGS1538]|uniref:enoyl-CoA hydratase/isomerase family protein n=1 Tax=Alcaligenes sp. WGS1538 TaxID=3366811 RepID=UPI00372D0E0B
MIRTHIAEHWLEITLDRPERRNALTNAMYDELAEQIRQADRNTQWRALILNGAGEHFCAGNDLSELSSVRTDEEPPAIRFLKSLVQADIPIIVAVEGHAVGIGVTLLLHADFVFAARDARLRMPFTALGLCPEGASSHLLAQIVGPRRASQWLLQSQAFTAEQAMQDGLLTELTDPGNSLEAARACARTLAEQPPLALRASKRLLRAPQRQTLLEVLERERQLFLQLLQSDEARQILAQMAARRNPG